MRSHYLLYSKNANDKKAEYSIPGVTRSCCVDFRDKCTAIASARLPSCVVDGVSIGAVSELCVFGY